MAAQNHVPAPGAKPTQIPSANPDSVSDPESEDEDPWISTCICGSSTPPLDSAGNTSPEIMCDVCSGATEHWQHNVCMGLPLSEEELPDHYVCHLCDAEVVALQRLRGEGKVDFIGKCHEETRQALSRGERIWGRRVERWRKEVLMIRSGVLGAVEVVGDPRVADVRVRRKVKVRIWVRPREEKAAGAKAQAPPVGEKERRPKSKAAVRMPTKVRKRTVLEEPEVKPVKKAKVKPPRKKAKHHDGKSY